MKMVEQNSSVPMVASAQATGVKRIGCTPGSMQNRPAENEKNHTASARFTCTTRLRLANSMSVITISEMPGRRPITSTIASVPATAIELIASANQREASRIASTWAGVSGRASAGSGAMASSIYPRFAVCFADDLKPTPGNAIDGKTGVRLGHRRRARLAA